MSPPVVADHLVVAAATLADGVAWCEATLGVTPAGGGRHPLMGTHNRLLQLSGPGFADCYLEIVAVDPDAPPPRRPRWYELDTRDLRGGPRLVHLVARTTAIEHHRAALAAAGLDPGDAVTVGRDTPEGRLTWQLLLRADGRLDCGGALPTLIQWAGRHPAATLPASGVVLQSVALAGLPPLAAERLGLQGVSVRAAGSPVVTAVLATPRGPVTLQSIP